MKNKNPTFCFVNNQPFPCGCCMEFSDGRGEFSSVIRVYTCKLHTPSTNPTDDAIKNGFSTNCSGSWTKRLN